MVSAWFKYKYIRINIHVLEVEKKGQLEKMCVKERERETKRQIKYERVLLCIRKREKKREKMK